jgi:outer membrane protein
MVLPLCGFRRLVLFAGSVFLMLTGFPVSATVAEANDVQLTLAEAVARALENNHEIKALKSSSAAGKSDIGIARSALLPRVSLEERYLRTNNPGYAFMSRLNQARIETTDFNPDILNSPSAINDCQSSITIEQPIFVKKALVGLEMSRTESLAREEEVRRKQEEVAFQVVRAGLGVLTAREYVQVATLGVEDAGERLRIAGVRYKNDVGQYADTLRAATSLTESRQRLNTARKNVRLARRALGVLLGTTESPDVRDTAFELTLRELESYTKVADGRGDLRAFALRGENARHNVRMAEAGYFPYVGVGGTYQFNDHNAPFGSEGRSWQVMAFLRWDLFDGTRREYERAKARHQESQAMEHLAAMRKGVSFKIYEAYLNVEEARQNIQLAEEALKTAEEGTRLVKLRYENGLSALSDLLNTQASLEQARAGVVERKNAYKTALAQLSFESGTILQDLNLDSQVR